MDRIKPVSEQELAQIERILQDVRNAISTSMAYTRKFQGWEFEHLEKRFTGISTSTWKRYLQPSYTKMRPLHIVAAYSWLTMLPMICFYRGLNINKAYPDVDQLSIECLIHSGLLPKKQFDLIVHNLHRFLTHTQKQSLHREQATISEQYGSLDDYADSDLIFPTVLDIDAFAVDYYSSLAISFKAFRETNGISKKTMAHILNLSEHRYQQCENPEKPIPLPVELGARLQMGFRLPDAIAFTRHMNTFPQFHTVRRVQQIRQTILISIMKYIDASYKEKVLMIIKNMSLTIREIEKSNKTLQKIMNDIS